MIAGCETLVVAVRGPGRIRRYNPVMVLGQERQTRYGERSCLGRRARADGDRRGDIPVRGRCAPFELRTRRDPVRIDGADQGRAGRCDALRWLSGHSWCNG